MVRVRELAERVSLFKNAHRARNEQHRAPRRGKILHPRGSGFHNKNRPGLRGTVDPELFCRLQSPRRVALSIAKSGQRLFFHCARHMNQLSCTTQGSRRLSVVRLSWFMPCVFCIEPEPAHKTSAHLCWKPRCHRGDGRELLAWAK